MVNYRRRIHCVIDLVGFLVLCFGIIIVTSGFMLQSFGLPDLETIASFRQTTCQYWSGIPTILTGAVLILTVRKQRQFLKYASMCCILITMVLTFGVIIQEVIHNSDIQRYIGDDRICPKDMPNSTGLMEHEKQRKKDCVKMREASSWYYILLFTADCLLVLCTFVLLLLFTEWILFFAQKAPSDQIIDQPPPSYDGGYAGDPTLAGQGQYVQYDQHALPLHPV